MGQLARNIGLIAAVLGGIASVAAGGIHDAAARSEPLASSHLPSTGRPAKPLAAWVVFCRDYPAECAINLAEPSSIALDAKAWTLLNAVNRQVNGSIRAVEDSVHWGVADRWDLAEDGSGDCEDFQLLKRKLLAEAGLPRRAMRMTVVIDERGEGHAVLAVATDRGDFVLDNKRDAVLPWRETGYVFVKRENADGLAWTSLGRDPSPVATANR